MEERPQFYPGILDQFSEAATEIHFKIALPSYQMLRILLALLDFRYVLPSIPLTAFPSVSVF